MSSGHTSQETHYISTTTRNRLMLFKETIAVYCANHTKHAMNRMQSTADGTYSNYWVS
jgi:hypothetical protein